MYRRPFALLFKSLAEEKNSIRYSAYSSRGVFYFNHSNFLFHHVNNTANSRHLSQLAPNHTAKSARIRWYRVPKFIQSRSGMRAHRMPPRPVEGAFEKIATDQ